ncbi:MAG: F0F1 ATP synthase subunit gamma [Balneolaceae bacterium]|nr:F0F1 ATP synthase subunit gamma [Balneolaceae bacterium]
MQTVEHYKRKIRNAEDLRSIVNTMKVLASVSIRQFEKASESLGEYYRTVEMGLQIVLGRSLLEEMPYMKSGLESNTIIIAIGSGQGLCGSFDERIMSFIEEQLVEENIYEPKCLVMGERLASQLEQKQTVTKTFTLPGSVSGLNRYALQLLTAVEELREKHKAGKVVIIHNKPVARGRYQPRIQYLLPLDRYWLNRLANKKWPTNNIPQFTMDPTELFSHMIRQYLLVSLYRAMAESLAAEHTGRLNSMTIAEQKIEERLQELNKRYAGERHKAITEELLDIQSGYRAVAE